MVLVLNEMILGERKKRPGRRCPKNGHFADDIPVGLGSGKVWLVKVQPAEGLRSDTFQVYIGQPITIS